MVRSAGFTLVEVLVSLVVLEVGLLGVIGSLTLAARSLARAETLERGVTVVERVYDSLLAAGAWSGSGSTTDGRLRLGWTVADDGWALLVVDDGGSLPLLTLEARVSPWPVNR